MEPFGFSIKLQEYINSVEDKTHKEVQIKLLSDLGLSGMKARFIPDPEKKYIVVQMDSRQNKDEIEHNIAHEVTHGLLYYDESYSELKPIKSLTETQNQELSILVTMIEDILVNYIIDKEGFSPFSPMYLNQVNHEIKAINNGIDIYSSSFPDENFKKKFMVFRFVMAWGFLNFFPLEKEAKESLTKFTTRFKYSFPKLFIMAYEIINIILKYNVLDLEGNHKAILECLQLWGLDHFVAIE